MVQEMFIICDFCTTFASRTISSNLKHMKTNQRLTEWLDDVLRKKLKGRKLRTSYIKSNDVGFSTVNFFFTAATMLLNGCYSNSLIKKMCIYISFGRPIHILSFNLTTCWDLHKIKQAFYDWVSKNQNLASKNYLISGKCLKDDEIKLSRSFLTSKHSILFYGDKRFIQSNGTRKSTFHRSKYM